MSDAEYRGWSKASCEASLRQLRDRLGRLPLMADLEGQPGPSRRSVLNHWPTWNAALLDVFGRVNTADRILVPVPDDLTPSMASVYEAGYRARLEGDSPGTNPHERGNWPPDVWDRGWRAADLDGEDDVEDESP